MVEGNFYPIMEVYKNYLQFLCKTIGNCSYLWKKQDDGTVEG